jgi:hypothetical protein
MPGPAAAREGADVLGWLLVMALSSLVTAGSVGDAELVDAEVVGAELVDGSGWRTERTQRTEPAGREEV